jgi:hypothetical protein
MAIPPGQSHLKGIRMTMNTSIPRTETIMRTLSRSTPNRSLIEATVGLHYIPGNSAAYWSATGNVYEAHGTWSGAAQKRNGRDIDMGGAIHDEILRVFPRLAPIVALHMSDPDGFPMYAVENGRYHLEQGNLQHAAKLWRCSVEELPAVEDVEAYVEAQRPRWQSEALAAWELLRTLEES